jgi:hypothetical protein
MDALERQKERVLLWGLGLHTAALVVANLQWSGWIAPYQKAVEPYLIPTAQLQVLRGTVAPAKIAYQLSLSAVTVDGRTLPTVSGFDLPVGERAFLVDAARRTDPGPVLDAAVLALLPRLAPDGEAVATVTVAIAKRSLPDVPFEPLAPRVVHVAEGKP